MSCEQATAWADTVVIGIIVLGWLAFCAFIIWLATRD